jgi:CIC family chloride channel protein
LRFLIWPRGRAAEAGAGEVGLVALALLALLAGAGSGFIVAIFRLALGEADDWRAFLVRRAYGAGLGGFLATLAVAAAAAAGAAALVRRLAPYASGSGIPQVEAALTGDMPAAPPRLIIVKFLGGLLAIGAGMALGREGPSVQMGAALAHLVGRLFRRGWPDLRILLAAGAGAGLAVAFNAPIAGAVFVLEELVRRFEPRIAIAAIGSSSTAILISRLLLGPAPDFQITMPPPPGLYAAAAIWPFHIALGAVAGVAAALYNRMLLGMLAFVERFAHWPAEAWAAAIGAIVGIVLWFAPDLAGGGDPITARVLSGGVAIATLPLAFLLRFGLGPWCYAARTPGGLFAPLLVLGAQLGFLCGAVCRFAFPDLGIEPQAFAIIGMAAFFAGVVQAPVTGIVLVTEMTAAFTTLLPMLAACFAAMLAVNLLKTAPIYDSLRERILAAPLGGRAQADLRDPL